MAKKIEAYIKLQVPAGGAKPSPPVGPALGQHGLNIMEFCKAPDVPLPPPDEDTLKRRHRSKEWQQRLRVVWLESSLVSAAAAATGGDNGLNQVH